MSLQYSMRALAQKSRFSNPMTGDSLERAHAAHGEQHARHERLAVDRVVADRERLTEIAEDHLLVGDEPGQAHRVDRRRLAAARLRHQLGGARGGAAGRVELGVVVQLDDLGLVHVLRGLRGEAHHQHGADREVGGDQHVRALVGPARRAELAHQRRGVKAGGPDHHVHAGAHAGERVLERRVGRR